LYTLFGKKAEEKGSGVQVSHRKRSRKEGECAKPTNKHKFDLLFHNMKSLALLAPLTKLPS
jgi:hypothetical protein